MVLTGLEARRTLVAMFERFTDRARRVVVLAQEEARGLKHNFIGTEHILLALLDERDGVGARALTRFGMQPEPVREEIKVLVGTGASAPPTGHIPFTPRAKKVLELALREALQLNHDYIGTEHVLLGVIREGDGVGAQILKAHAADLEAVRITVIDLLEAYGAGRGSRRLRRFTEPVRPGEHTRERAETPATPAAKAGVAEAERLAGEQAVGSHHLMLGALSDPNAAAAQALSELGVDLEQVRERLRGIDVTGTSDELPEDAGRRQMIIRVDEDKLTIEATDRLIVSLGQAALAELGDQADPPGTIRGSLPASASLSDLWLALRDSLAQIRRSAAAPADAPGAPTEAGDKPEKAGDKPGSAEDKPGGPGSEVA
jgi:ATP-dependent Clp protease ATP-binding subunit ClpA